MLNGRHLVLLGGLAAAGLLSVREGQKQTDICYRIATIEKEIREVHIDRRQTRTEHLALQSPKAMTNRANELKLAVLPVPAGAQTSQIAQNNSTNSKSNSRRALPAPPAPVVPALPSAIPLMNTDERTAAQ